MYNNLKKSEVLAEIVGYLQTRVITEQRAKRKAKNGKTGIESTLIWYVDDIPIYNEMYNADTLDNQDLIDKLKLYREALPEHKVKVTKNVKHIFEWVERIKCDL